MAGHRLTHSRILRDHIYTCTSDIIRSSVLVVLRAPVMSDSISLLVAIVFHPACQQTHVIDLIMRQTVEFV